MPAKIYNRVLVGFNMLFDTDVGLLYTIRDKYNSPEIFKSDYLNNVSKEALLTELINMEKDDPLSIILRDDVNIDKESLYSQLYNEEYESILSNSVCTNVTSLLQLSKSTGTVDITVLCKNEYEEHLISSKMPGYKIIRFSRALSLDMYDTLYMKSIYDISKFVIVQAKNIYVSNHRYNFEDYDNFIPIGTICGDWIEMNKFSVIDLYDRINYLG